MQTTRATPAVALLLFTSSAFALVAIPPHTPPQNGKVEGDGLPRHTIAFPKGAGHADVKLEYGAKGDGVADDTEALQKAFNSNNDDHGRLIYLPAGTYLVSKKLVCMRDGQPWYGLQLIGEHREKTIIRLKDRCPGFNDPAKPETVVQFSSKGSVWGNMAHWNSCWNLTIDTGSGNPGAIATNYYASNHGSMRDCTIRSGDGAGVCGINMDGPWPGPCLVANTHVIGFDTGIAVGTREYGVTFRAITLERQRKVGFWNNSNMVSIHRLHVLECAGPAIQNLRRDWVPGMLSLIDSELNGRGLGIPAIENNRSVVWLRNVAASGYQGVVKDVPSPAKQYSNHPAQSLWPEHGPIPDLSVIDPPDIPWDPPEKWAHGGNARQTQHAIDSGATTVYIPYGEHTYEEPVIIRGNVRRILGMKSNLWNGKGLNGRPMWIYESTNAPEVEINFLTCGRLEHRSPKALVLRTMRGCAYSGNAKGCGPLFIEDICAGRWDFTNPIDVYAWQWNPECDDYQVKANGGRFWVCGWKTEGNGTQFILDRSQLEIFGGLVYPHNMKTGIPMFVWKDSAAAVLIRFCSYGQGPNTPDRVHDVKVIETRGNETKQTEKIEERLLIGGDAALLADLRKGAPEATEIGAAAKPKTTPILKRRKATPEALAAWDAKLKARIAGDLKAGRRATFLLSSMKMDVQVTALADDGAMRLFSQGLEVPGRWQQLTLEERRNLAVASAREGDNEGQALAVFFCIALGAEDQAEKILQRMSDGAKVKEALDAFQPAPTESKNAAGQAAK
jgi:hypothetical protein